MNPPRTPIRRLARRLSETLSRLSGHAGTLHRLAYLDSLTGLPNRASFEQDLLLLGDKGQRFALLFLDLDRFRTINDGYGHRFGDRLLRDAATRLAELCNSGALAYRYSGDLFAVLLTAAGEQNFRVHAAAEAERLRLGMSELYVVDERRLPLSASFGVALYPDDGADLDVLTGAADAAMYEAKTLGRNVVYFARGELALKARRRVELAEDLRIALREGQITPHFQPIVDIAAGEVICAEALARWRHPQRGYISPDEFIPIAEDSGQIDALTDCLLREACRVAVGWQQAGLRRRLAFNLSARQVRPGVVELIAGILADSGLPAELLEIEITESAIIERPEAAERLLRDLKTLGVSVVLDDFGTGYSSLSHLLRYPIDKIKVDKSFVAKLEGNGQAAKIISATVALANSLDLRLVAEGVENFGQMLMLYELGCHNQQGWMFTRALPAEELDRWAYKASLKLDTMVRSRLEPSNDAVAAA